MTNKSLTLVNQAFRRSDITSKISIRFPKVQKVKRVKVNCLYWLSYIYSQVTRISSITIQTMKKNNYSLRTGSWFRAVIVKSKRMIVERWFGWKRKIVDCLDSLYLRSLEELFQKGTALLVWDGFVKFFVVFKRVGVHEENYIIMNKFDIIGN